MRETVLHDWHVSRGATMTDFHGWHMPLYYRGITEEHLHTRTRAGVFDLGHMGRVLISGTGARAFVDHLTPARVQQGEVGEVQYSFLLREDGTTIDDITVYYEPNSIFLVINAGNRDRDIEWIRTQAAQFNDVVEIVDLSDAWGMIAIQGPNAKANVERLFGGSELPAYYHFAHFDDTVGQGPLIVSCTGYTGENGYEFYLPAENTQKLWEALISVAPEMDVQPIGLGARDSLRLEASMPLYGHELTDETTPLHAGLGKFVDLEKPSFIGRDALLALKQNGGPSQKLVAFEMKQRGPVAREGFDVYGSDGMPIGRVASGIFSPTLQKIIGTAYVAAQHAAVGGEIQIDIRGRKHPATLIKRPFYRRSA